MIQERTSFTIGDLAAQFGVTARALRFYEGKGLLQPRRRGQTRLYTVADRARLALILRGKRVGFALDEIKDMLDVAALESGAPAALASALARFEARLEVLEQQRADLEAALADVRAGRDWLAARIAGQTPSDALKARAAAFEALAQSWFDGATGPGEVRLGAAGNGARPG